MTLISCMYSSFVPFLFIHTHIHTNSLLAHESQAIVMSRRKNNNDRFVVFHVQDSHACSGCTFIFIPSCLWKSLLFVLSTSLESRLQIPRPKKCLLHNVLSDNTSIRNELQRKHKNMTSTSEHVHRLFEI